MVPRVDVLVVTSAIIMHIVRFVKIERDCIKHSVINEKLTFIFRMLSKIMNVFATIITSVMDFHAQVTHL